MSKTKEVQLLLLHETDSDSNVEQKWKEGFKGHCFLTEKQILMVF